MAVLDSSAPFAPAPGLGPDETAGLTRRLTIVVGVATLGLLVLLPFDPRLAALVPYRAFLPLHTVFELLAAVVGFAIFSVHWHAAAARDLRSPRAVFLGAVFLAVALLDVLHAMAYEGMPGVMEAGNPDQAIWYWLVGRYVLVGGLVAAPLVPRTGRGVLASRALLATAVVVFVVLVALADPLLDVRGLFFRPGVGVTHLKIGLELGVMALALGGIGVHVREFRRTGERTAAGIAAALALVILSESLFTLYHHVNDLENLLGHVYKIVAYYVVFDALFVTALVRPYRRLDETVQALKASNLELTGLREHVAGELAQTIRRLEETSLAEHRARERGEDLLRMVSHDLRSPLSAITLQAQRLERLLAMDTEPPKMESAVTAIRRSAGRMASMIEDLVASERIAAGGIQVEPRPVDVRTTVEGLLATSGGALDVERIRVEIPRDPPLVQADPEALERILTNLLTNAMKYSAPGTPIVLSSQVRGEDLHISVSDRGPGIAPEDLPRIFDRYYRARNAKRGTGLGLGLFIIRGLAEAQGGRIGVESTPGEGSTFTLTLPTSA